MSPDASDPTEARSPSRVIILVCGLAGQWPHKNVEWRENIKTKSGADVSNSGDFSCATC